MKGTTISNEIVTRTIDATLKVLVKQTYDALHNRPSKDVKEGTGTAFLIPASSPNPRARLALTCFHVVAEASRVELELPRSKLRVQAKIRSVNPDHDMALLSFVAPDEKSASTLKPLQFGQSNELRLGESLFIV